MKLLHTCDLHIGRLLYGQSLEADHEVVLNQILDVVRERKPDVLILAGDIFDRVSPPAFGSLDPDSLDQVLQTLQGLTSGSRSVGIISERMLG